MRELRLFLMVCQVRYLPFPMEQDVCQNAFVPDIIDKYFTVYNMFLSDKGVVDIRTLIGLLRKYVL